MPLIEVFLRENQSLVDLAMERYGAFEGLFVIVQDNPNLTIGDRPDPPTTTAILIRSEVPELTSNNRKIKALYDERGIQVNNETYNGAY